MTKILKRNTTWKNITKRIIKEAHELNLIFTTIIKNAKETEVKKHLLDN